MTALACALVSGAMFYLAMGLDDVWWLAFLAPVPLLWLAYGGRPSRQVFAAGLFAYGAGQTYLFQCYAALMPVAMLAAMAAAFGILFAAALLFARAARRRLSPLAALFAFPAAWAGIEYLAGLVSPHGSFGALGYAVASFPAVLQIASLFGLYAVTFTVCLAANALALIARGEKPAGGAGLALFALVLAFGFARLAAPQAPPVKVAALADPDSWHRAQREHSLAAALAGSRQYADAIRRQARDGVRVFAIPETAIRLRPESQTAVLAPLAAAAKDTGALVVAGAFTATTPPRNRAFAFPGGGTARVYDKRHPLRPFDSEIAGTAPGLIGGGRAMAICKDLDFPGTIRGDAGHGLTVMIVPANDFERDGWIHGRMAVLRGVENGFAVLRSAFKGLETASDAQGRVLAQAGTLGHGMIVMTAELPPGPGPTLYTRIGDLFAWLCLAAVLAMAAAMAGRWRPRRHPQSDMPG